MRWIASACAVRYLMLPESLRHSSGRSSTLWKAIGPKSSANVLANRIYTVIVNFLEKALVSGLSNASSV